MTIAAPGAQSRLGASRPYLPEKRPDILGEQTRHFHRREVAAFGHVAPVRDVVDLLGPRPRWSIDLAWKTGDAGRHHDPHAATATATAAITPSALLKRAAQQRAVHRFVVQAHR